MSVLKVVDLPGSAPNDIPRMLRLLADDIESGKEAIEDAVLVGIDGEMNMRTWLWGMHRRGSYHTVGMLEAAKIQMAAELLEAAA